ncbi:hypothetical protein AALO_G00188710 [Alosa alosa]|uniref:Uncharacterized protein n=1 Tax=Alosa alosa TaxID=278164 RepID=A0AAV6G699_9TELE|nr:hypothetical protein AALO_G00188710 [Alosa alosa]
MPEEPTSPEVPVVPLPANSVAVRCGENNILVEVNQDFFGTRQLIEPDIDGADLQCSAWRDRTHETPE